MRDGIETADRILFLYDRVLDNVIPWNEFDQILDIDNFYKFRLDCSDESATLIGQVETSLAIAVEGYFSASRNAYAWTTLATPLLNIYISLFKSNTSEKTGAQSYVLRRALDECVRKFRASQELLYKSSHNFNDAADRLVTLLNRFESEFHENSAFVQDIRSGRADKIFFGVHDVAKSVPELMTTFKRIQTVYENLKNAADGASKDIAKIGKLLNNEIQHLANVNEKIEEAEALNTDLDHVKILRDTVIKSAQELVANSDKYRTRHTK